MSFENLFDLFKENYELTHDWDSDASVWAFSDYTWKLLEESNDPYSLMVSFVSYGYLKSAMLVTYGWAAPMDSSLPPSKNPEKKRVRICLFLEHETMITSMEIRDIPGINISEDPTGNMIDVANEYLYKAKGFVNKNKNVIDEEPF